MIRGALIGGALGLIGSLLAGVAWGGFPIMPGLTFPILNIVVLSGIGAYTGHKYP